MISRKPMFHVHDIGPACRSPHADKKSQKKLGVELRPLTSQDAPSCYALELVTFAPRERASLEKYQYRLATSSELSLGMFTAREDGEEGELVGQISATRTADDAVTDRAVDMPEHTSAASPGGIGHVAEGRTVCLHTLAVSPRCQRTGLGRHLMATYLHRLQHSPTVDRVALIARAHLVPFYESFGFECRGASRCTRYGEGWLDLVWDARGGGVSHVNHVT